MATKTRRLADFLANIDDDSRVTSAGLLDATITADDLAANSVTATELADDAVDTDAIADNAVDADKIATGAVVADGIGAGAVVTAGLGAGAVTVAKMGSDVIEVKPHIVPGKLYPAWSGLLDNHTGYTFTDSSAISTSSTSSNSVIVVLISGSTILDNSSKIFTRSCFTSCAIEINPSMLYIAILNSS